MLVLLWLLVFFGKDLEGVSAMGRYDPCNTPGLASRGNGFFVGLALWPGGSISQWGAVYNSTTLQYGLNPCNTTGTVPGTNQTAAAYLAAQGVVFASYLIQVDALVTMTVNVTDLDYIINGTAAGALPYVSMIAFRGAYRSEAVYIYSQSTAYNQATGFVTSLSLTLSFKTGNLQSLAWSDFNCNDCGGPFSSTCMVTKQPIPQQSCTAIPKSCGSVASNGTDCSLNVYGGFSGSDKYGTAFTTSLQLSQINQFALSSYYYDALQQLFAVQNTINTGAIGSQTLPPATGSNA